MIMQHESVLAAVQASRLDGLRRIRDELARAFGSVEPSVLPQLSAQLAKVMGEIEALESASPEVSESDRIRAELAAGLSESGVVELAGRRRKPKAG